MKHNKLSKSLGLLLLILVWGCSTSKRSSSSEQDPTLEQFANALIGDFSSKQQSESDTAYFNISLVMTRIWPDRGDGIWLYVEQAMAANLSKPYRQRVYKLTKPSAFTFSSEIYTIRNQKDVIGFHKDATKSGLLTFDQIDLKKGCEVILQFKNGVYTGGTIGSGCPSDLRGASYATTKITLTNDLLNSWDQGFDQSGKQVWGATKGGYVFNRIK